MDETPIMLLAAQSVFGLYGALYVGSAICGPNWFLNNLAINHIQRRRRNRDRYNTGDPWWTWPWTIFTMLAVGVLIYAALYAVVAVIPHDWGSPNEDGDWQSARQLIQYGVGFVGAVGLVGTLEKNAEVLVWGPIEKKARDEAIKAFSQANGVTREMRDSIAKSAETALEPRYFVSSSFASEYEKDVQRWVVSGIRH